MKKLLCMTLALMMVVSLTASALAEETGAATKTLSLSGNVVAGQTITVKAPFGGIVADYTLRTGDQVRAGDALLALQTTKVYAPCDGVVTGFFAKPGDEVQYVTERYGALLYIEPTSPFTMNANVSTSYNENENKIIHIGEEVYLRSVNSSTRAGTGFVTSVDGKNYTVEVTSGTLRFDERANIYRSSEYEDASCIGQGKTARTSAQAVTGAGSVLAVHASDGKAVKRGDLLLETVSGTLAQRQASSGTVTSPATSVVASIEAAPGTSVVADQVLLTLYPIEGYQVAANVNETDLPGLAIGDPVSLTFLSLEGKEPLSGRIASISSVSATESGDAEYTVYVDFTADVYVREGMSVTAMFGK